MTSFKEWHQIFESKEVIVSLGFPEVVSRLLYEQFGKNAPLIAKWYKQYRAYGSYAESPDWWRLVTWNPRETPSLYELTFLYQSTTDPATYKAAARKMDLDVDDDFIDDYYLQDQRDHLIKQIRYTFFDYTFFKSYSLIKDIQNGTLTDLAPYKKLQFIDAQHKYDRRNIFHQTQPIKVYANGFKWINVGKRCSLVGSQMSNCGSVGLMSMDKDATIITLFGPNNKPHVLVTYSPNQKRISGDQSAGSTAVKEKYHDYVIDLARTLGVSFDANNSKSTVLKIKYLLRNGLQRIESIQSGSPYDELFKITFNNQVYYTDGYTVIAASELQRAENMVAKGLVTLRYQSDNAAKTALARANLETLSANGIQYLPLSQLAGE